MIRKLLLLLALGCWALALVLAVIVDSDMRALLLLGWSAAAGLAFLILRGDQ